MSHHEIQFFFCSCFSPSFPQSRLSLRQAAAASMDASRRLDIASLFPLPGMGVGMNVSDMASYSHYPPHYSYQVSGCALHRSHSMRIKRNENFNSIFINWKLFRVPVRCHNMINTRHINTWHCIMFRPAIWVQIKLLAALDQPSHQYQHNNHIMPLRTWVRPFHQACI